MIQKGPTQTSSDDNIAQNSVLAIGDPDAIEEDDLADQQYAIAMQQYQIRAFEYDSMVHEYKAQRAATHTPPSHDHFQQKRLAAIENTWSANPEPISAAAITSARTLVQHHILLGNVPPEEEHRTVEEIALTLQKSLSFVSQQPGAPILSHYQQHRTISSEEEISSDDNDEEYPELHPRLVARKKCRCIIS